MYAIAFDLGTTTLAAALVDCSNGRRLAAAGSLNPQRRYGADVVSRLDAALHTGNAAMEMTALIRSELARLAADLLQQAGLRSDAVGMTAVAGNPAMQHLLAGWPVESLARPPFRPRQTAGVTMPASELGWEFGQQVYLFPQPGGFVGGDTLAFLFAARTCAGPAPVLYLDMGTNGELVLDDGETLWATAAAAGPAFEGGNLTCGMAALPGAISRIDWQGERLTLSVLGGGMPRGICGSAALDLVAELVHCGAVDRTGRLLPAAEISSSLATRIGELHGEAFLTLYRDAATHLRLTQSDIRQLQLAKAALRAAVEVLLERSRIRCDAVRTVLLTGSFGAVLQPATLKTVGILNEEMVHTCRFFEEGALVGVERLLAASDGIAAVEALAAGIRVLPLSGTPLFERKFLEQIDFPV